MKNKELHKTIPNSTFSDLQKILDNQCDYLLNHTCSTINKSALHLPGSDFVDRIFLQSDRNNRVISSLQTLYDSGRLGGTGYLSILPVDQGHEHGPDKSFLIAGDRPPSVTYRIPIQDNCGLAIFLTGEIPLLLYNIPNKIEMKNIDKKFLLIINKSPI